MTITALAAPDPNEPQRPDDPYQAGPSNRVAAALAALTAEVRRIADALQPVELEPVERTAEPVRDAANVAEEVAERLSRDGHDEQARGAYEVMSELNHLYAPTQAAADLPRDEAQRTPQPPHSVSGDSQDPGDAEAGAEGRTAVREDELREQFTTAMRDAYIERVLLGRTSPREQIEHLAAVCAAVRTGELGALEDQWQQRLADLQQEYERQRAVQVRKLREARASATRVRTLHARTIRLEAAVCAHDGHAYPCPTISVLDVLDPQEPLKIHPDSIAALTDQTINDLRAAVDRTEAERDGAYRERAQLLAWLAAIYQDTTVIAPAADVDEPGWQLLYLNAGGWQMTWHIAPADAELFGRVKHVTRDDQRAPWDGHTTEQKYERLESYVRAIATGRVY